MLKIQKRGVVDYLSFDNNRIFQKKITEKVDQYFATTQQSMRGRRDLYLKAGLMLSGLVLSYCLLVFSSLEFIYKLPLIGVLILSLVGLQFNCMHDANHSSFSTNKVVNRLMSFVFDLVGGSSYLWRLEHNRQHHRYPNVTQYDPDLDHSNLLRLSSDKPRAWYHRYEAYYIWLLFPLVPVRWHFWGDFEILWLLYKNESSLFPSKLELTALLGWKICFYCLAFVIPFYFYSIPAVLGVYFLIFAGVGLIVAPVFEVAHINDKVDVIHADQITDHQIGWEYYTHQMKTTSNFSRKNRWLSWYVGGLNFQIEHHLFPHISHVHYPALSHLVEETCQECNIPYHTFDSFWQALGSHHRQLKRMGVA